MRVNVSSLPSYIKPLMAGIAGLRCPKVFTPKTNLISPHYSVISLFILTQLPDFITIQNPGAERF
ncbi:hypothetical protein [Helicobacter sp. 11S02596-1]|uniref:hypothetical protein n=1 Tax=Helicobacter sp. 11S02596-1 TaxID=1476194 RepID=UPI000BA7CC74|nr:hypothetical protein [Helicobacter sp. 11S02596-1]PAF43570.1 hypothetical protein BJI48_04760 [Helicobacter sp. 11S02596-1]